jgi:purine-nucleoside phosphorylase
MLRELTRADWQAILGLATEQLPHALILRGTRNLKHHYRAYAEWFDDVVEVGSPNGAFEDVFIAQHGGLRIAYASVYGAAMASEITHLFGVLGARLVVQTGCCGALADGFEAGDLFLAMEACCGEGAARYYLPDATAVRSTVPAGKVRPLASHVDLPIHEGKIYTTAALLAEGHREIEAWHDDGFSAVDMETATTFAVAEHFGMERLSILFGFDNPRRKSHILLTDAEKGVRRARGNRVMIELALAVIRDYFLAGIYNGDLD